VLVISDFMASDAMKCADNVRLRNWQKAIQAVRSIGIDPHP
jgi:hypothetical protein